MTTVVGLLLLGATVVLDPGHGGTELGAVGPNGIKEKDVVLRIAEHTRQRLIDSDVRVLMTRTDDRSVSLAARLRLAHRHGAPLVSIHLNSSPERSRRGVETYVASVLGIDGEAADLVHREESEAAPPVAEAPSQLDALLFDLRSQAAHRRSARLAATIQADLETLGELGPGRGLRQAPFYLLKNARVPCVLVEAGYVSHPGQSRFLGTSTGQKQIGERIASGIIRFLGI